MERTQIYLTKEEQSRLRSLAKRLGKKQSQLIRDALDSYLDKMSEAGRKEHFRRFRGMWEGRDLSEFSEIREQLNRRLER